MTDESLDLVGTSQASIEQKMVPQSTVNAVVMREREDAANKALREAEAKFQEQLKSIQPVDKDALFAEWEERANANAKEARAREESERVNREFDAVKQSYYGKLVAGKSKGDEYDKLMREFPHESYPALMIGSNNFDNTSDMAEYWAENPIRAEELERLAARNYNGFLKELKKISETLEANTSAAEREPKINTPLSRNKSNITGSNIDPSSWEAIRADKSLRL